MSMKILFTGVDGFIARKLYYKFSMHYDQYEIYGFDEKGYLAGEHEKLIGIDFDIIFHLAAIARTVDCTLDPFERSFNSNVRLTNFILQKLSFKKIVYTSSCAIYGNQKQFPITEESLPNCPSIYAAQKLYSENLIHFYCQSIKKTSVCLRLFNTYGPKQSQVGSYPNVLASLIRKFKQGGYVEVTGDGTQTRDFVHVQDVVMAIGKAGLGIDSGNHIFNVCSGVETSINQIASLFDCEIRYVPDRDFDIRKQVGSFDKINKALDWKPMVPLIDGIKHTLDYEIRGIK